jgi:beta-galactosidase
MPRLGVAYYPEQWPRERWETDAALMAEAGLTLARVGEFAWAQLEPEEGRFDFGWLDAALDVLGAAGLQIVLGTPTAAPPIWLVERYSDVLPVNVEGRTLGFGHRRHYCPRSPSLHAATKRVVSALADRYGPDPRVVAWQVDNEFGGRCFCERCRAAFQSWLHERYGSLDTLNELWGTAFWSQTYSDWRQIPLPESASVPLPGGFLRQSPNPGLALDFRRFTSDSYVQFQRLQIQILREHCPPEQLLTHNMMGFRFPEIDYHELARDLDVVGWTNYPLLDDSGRWSTSGLSADAMRGLKEVPVWVLEQQVGPLGWEVLWTPRRGQMRLLAYQAVAHGAEVLVFFRWRTARFGTEQHWHGILDHDGTPRRRYAEVKALAAELERLGSSLEGGRPRGDAAILHDYDSRFALQVQPTSTALRYEETVQRHYESLRRLGLGVDVVSATTDLGRYSIVVAPNLYIVDTDTVARLATYVEGGGTLVLAPRTAVKDRANALPERPFPAWLDELAGLTVSDYASGPDSVRASFAADDGSALKGEFSGWLEELDLEEARPRARYLEGEFAGTTAVAEHRLGAGRVVYFAGAAHETTLLALYRVFCAEAGLRLLDLPEDVELVRLENGLGGELSVLLNHGDGEQPVDLGLTEWRDLLRDERGSGPLQLAPFGVCIVEDNLSDELRSEAVAGGRRADR